MSIYDSELNPYSSIDDYTLDGLYTPLVNVEKQDDDKKPKKITADINPKKSSRTSVDSKDMFISPDSVVSTTSVSSKGTSSEAVKAPQKSSNEKTEEAPKGDETKAENPSEGVTEPPKRKRGRPRKIDVVPSDESKDNK